MDSETLKIQELPALPNADAQEVLEESLILAQIRLQKTESGPSRKYEPMRFFVEI
jgi:hypothetical protein